MAHCTDPNCTSLKHAHSPMVRGKKVVIPISENDAKIIDEARRRLISRIFEVPILPPTPNLIMTTRQIDMPLGHYEAEIHHITVTFTDDLPVRRARVSTMLRSHFGQDIKIEQIEGDNIWRFNVFISQQLTFGLMAELNAAIVAISSGMVEHTRIQGLYVSGLFVSEFNAQGEETFALSGDHDANNPWSDAA